MKIKTLAERLPDIPEVSGRRSGISAVPINPIELWVRKNERHLTMKTSTTLKRKWKWRREPARPV